MLNPPPHHTTLGEAYAPPPYWAVLLIIPAPLFDEKLQFSFILISCCTEIHNSLLALLISFLKIACLHVSFTAYEKFYKLSKMHCLLVCSQFSNHQKYQKTEIQQSIIYPLIHWFHHPLVHM